MIPMLRYAGGLYNGSRKPADSLISRQTREEGTRGDRAAFVRLNRKLLPSRRDSQPINTCVGWMASDISVS